ncbi:anti-sigma factor family protein [Mycolicibacterium celeriflavum]|uniref:anti-sigma factor family protein n=1 Tax=Mycolicibacterium celeriflavum TaxID=1249101 RepID=UPI003CE75599
MSHEFDRTPDDNLAEWDAAYVLGALSLEDRRTYEDYLAANPERAAELAELDEMPAILGALSRDEAVALADLGEAPAADNIASLAQAAAERQRRSRRTMLAATVAVAAALAIIGGVVGATIFPRTSSVQTVAMEPMQPGKRQGLTAQLAVTEKKWGTELNWACQYTKDWARDVDSYDIVVTTRDGGQTAVGSWRPAGDEAAGLSAATSIPTDEIRSIDIRVSGSDEPLAVRTL